MAEAPGHLLGQIIGNTLEESVEPIVERIAAKHGLYLDKKGVRPARRGKKLTWTDGLGNKHDLDFVLERGGSLSEIGRPAAFIESAWRRYTKHSRAKAQEIQGALLPLLTKYNEDKPFAGAVVAGEWTAGALGQMRSSGFAVLHIKYADIVRAFAEFGIDIDADENTPDDYLRAQVDEYLALSPAERTKLALSLCNEASDEYKAFGDALEASLSRRVTRVLVLPLHGERLEFDTVEGAATAVREYDASGSIAGGFVRFEIQMTYSNGDTLVATFELAADAIKFLESYAP